MVYSLNKSLKKKWFKFDAIYYKFVGYDGAGDANYLVGTPIKVLITGEMINIIDADGKTYVSKYVVYMDSLDVPDAKLDDKITILSKTYKIKQAGLIPNTKGAVDLWKVIL